MQSKGFIKNKLEELIKIYHNISIKYYFDKFDNDHFLLISPSEVLNDVVKNHAISIDMEFINLFPSESLNFIISEEDDSYDELVFSYIPRFDIVADSSDVLITNKPTKHSKGFRIYSSESYYLNDWINFKSSDTLDSDIQEIDEIYAIAS